mmetsp:Transcript_23441/g.73059  ORF Transcript_23441/g.73059 Transcript_23441/m.73059 type:complete len:367 (-) Transcript_23441:8-1108(-)
MSACMAETRALTLSWAAATASATLLGPSLASSRPQRHSSFASKFSQRPSQEASTAAMRKVSLSDTDETGSEPASSSRRRSKWPRLSFVLVSREATRRASLSAAGHSAGAAADAATSSTRVPRRPRPSLVLVSRAATRCTSIWDSKLGGCALTWSSCASIRRQRSSPAARTSAKRSSSSAKPSDRTCAVRRLQWACQSSSSVVLEVGSSRSSPMELRVSWDVRLSLPTILARPCCPFRGEAGGSFRGVQRSSTSGSAALSCACMAEQYLRTMDLISAKRSSRSSTAFSAATLASRAAQRSSSRASAARRLAASRSRGVRPPSPSPRVSRLAPCRWRAVSVDTAISAHRSCSAACEAPSRCSSLLIHA